MLARVYLVGRYLFVRILYVLYKYLPTMPQEKTIISYKKIIKTLKKKLKSAFFFTRATAQKGELNSKYHPLSQSLVNFCIGAFFPLFYCMFPMGIIQKLESFEKVGTTQTKVSFFKKFFFF